MAIDINIPSQVKTYANLAGFPATGSLKTIFIAEDTNKTYRWTGTAYVEISASQAASWGTITGTLSTQTDLNTALSGKVPTTRTLTINGTTQDLSADRTFTISTGITIGTTAITSGTVGRVLFEGTGNVVQESANLFWDNTNGRLGIGTASPQYRFHVNVADVTYSAIFSSPTGSVRFLPYLSSVYGANISTLNAGQTAQIPLSLSANKFIFENGNVLIGTTTDAGFKVDINGTARVSGVVTGTSFTATANGDSFKVGAYNVLDYGNGCRINYASGAQKVNIYSNTSGGGLTLHNSGNASIGSEATEVTSAILNVPSTTKGFLPPRMTTTQKNAIATPATGLMVYDTTLNLISVYNGTTWI